MDISYVKDYINYHGLKVIVLSKLPEKATLILSIFLKINQSQDIPVLIYISGIR